METEITSATKTHRGRSAHLMCGTRVWGIAGVLGCSYLAYLSYGHVRRGDFDWPHDVWSILTYGVWVLLMVGMMSETRCWRERIFFGLVMANFILGAGLAIWGAAPIEAVRDVRLISAWLWALAALVSLVVVFSSGREKGKIQ